MNRIKKTKSPQWVYIADRRRQIQIAGVCFIIFILLFFLRSYSVYRVEVKGTRALVYINFMLPMNQKDISKSIQIIPELPGMKFSCRAQWQGSNRMMIEVSELESPKGQSIELQIHKAQTKIPLLSKTVHVPIQFQIEPQVLEISPVDHIPTEGPVLIRFNTPMNLHMDAYMETDIDPKIEPLKIEHKGVWYEDYSRWMLYPSTPLKNNSNYVIILRKGLKAKSGLTLNKDIEQWLKTASKPKVTSITPKDQADWISIYPRITAEINESIIEGTVEIQGIKAGSVKISGKKLEYLPAEVLKPSTHYTAVIQVLSSHGEKSEPYTLDFTTMPLSKDALWVEVVLQEKHEVIIHKGDQIIRRMPASGGRPDQPTVLGTFYLGDRGFSFFSERFGEGATYWVRIVDQYLFHGIPRDREWSIIEKELHKLGKAASHGCVRLSEEDAKWFYENMPRNTMVIIHE